MTGAEGRSPGETRRIARQAGAVYVALGVATMFGFHHAPLVRGDLTAIARMLTGSELGFRIGVVTDLLSAVLAVPLAVLLYKLFEPVHRMRAAMMALLLLVAVPISFAVALCYVAGQWLLTGAPVVAAIAETQREALGMLAVRLHAHGVLAEEIFWGLWLVPFGLLVIRSGFIPRLLGILLIVAGGAYSVHSVVSLLLDGHRIASYEQVTMLARAAGELPIMLWLLVKGADPRWLPPAGQGAGRWEA